MTCGSPFVYLFLAPASLPNQLLLQPRDLAADRQAEPDEEQAQNDNGHSHDEVDFVDVRRSIKHNQHEI